MNIVYLLTNLDRKEGEPRYYIGSKVECILDELHGRNVIRCLKTNTVYWGSASSFQMKEDLKTCKFEASIIEKVNHRKDLLGREDFHIVNLNAVESNEYYNMSRAVIGGSRLSSIDTICNIYGEMVSEYGASLSRIGKRNSTAQKCGYENMADLCFKIRELRLQGMPYSKIGKDYCCTNNRWFSRKYVEKYDLEKFYNECYPFNQKLKEDIIHCLLEKASPDKIAEVLNIEVPTVIHYANDFIKSDKQFSVAASKGLTNEELQDKMLKKVLDGLSIQQASQELSMSLKSGERYFMRGLRRRLKSSDF